MNSPRDQQLDSSIRGIVLCELNGVPFGVPLESIVQALPFPRDIQALPRRDHALLGFFTARQQSYPLIDLRRWLPWPGGDTAKPEQVLILKHDHKLVAIAIDVVHGLRRVKQEQIETLVHSDDGEELFQKAIRITDTVNLSARVNAGLLDIQNLMTLSQAWVAEEVDSDGIAEVHEDEKSDSTSEPRWCSCALFHINQRHIAIPAEHVAAILPMPHVEKILGANPDWLGMCHWRERDVPVISTLETVGVNPCGSTKTLAKLLVIVVDGARHVGLPVDEVDAIKRLDLNQIQDIESAGFKHNPSLQGVFNLNGEAALLLLDGKALVSECPMSTLSTLTTADENIEKSRQLSHESYVVVQSGPTYAIAMSYLDAIITLPASLSTIASDNPAKIGTFNWKQRVIPLWDLKQLKELGVTTQNPECRVLIIQEGDTVFGLLVENLVVLLPSRSGQVVDFGSVVADISQVILVEQGSYTKSYGILDPLRLDGVVEVAEAVV